MANGLKDRSPRSPAPEQNKPSRPSDLLDQQQRIEGSARPARFPNHDVEPERGEVVGIRVGRPEPAICPVR
jgi:hypothetical protein